MTVDTEAPHFNEQWETLDFEELLGRSGETKRQFEIAALSLEAIASARRDLTGYVRTHLIVRRTSGLVFLVCCYSIIIWLLSVFQLINPLFAMITIIPSPIFFLMGKVIERNL